MNERKTKVHVQRTREVVTYAEFWHTSLVLLAIADKHAEGSDHTILASLVFTAFTFEAFLNHLGAKLFSPSLWRAIERLNPHEKLTVIADDVGCPINRGERPWQIMRELFQFRSEIAHGKSTVIEKIDRDVPLEESYAYNLKFAETKWMEFSSRKNAQLAREDVASMVERILEAYNAKTGQKEHPFQFGWMDTLTSLAEEPGAPNSGLVD